MEAPHILQHGQSEFRNLHLTLRADLQGFCRLAERLKALIGVDLPPTEKNRVLMACRLVPVLRRRACRNYAEYEGLLRAGRADVMQEFLSVLTTHTTEFFREPKHFEVLDEWLRGSWADQRCSQAFRVWCAAASTGQEPYSILFTLLQSPRLKPEELKFLATDIDRRALGRAVAGRYTSMEMKGVPDRFKRTAFEMVPEGRRPMYLVRNNVKRWIRFAELNLTQQPYPFAHPFHVIFCRNVLIYFERAIALQVVESLIQALAPSGLLFLGHAETGLVRAKQLKRISPGIYQK